MIVCIILNYNDWVTTIRLVESIKDYKVIDKIVIVDNCSSDDSYEHLENMRSNKIDLIKTDYNKGYASGNNYGINYAISCYNPEYLVISNPDVHFEEKVIFYLLDCFEKNSEAGMVTCKMKNMSDIKLPFAWKLPQYKDCIKENLLLLRRLFGDDTFYNPSFFRGAGVKSVEVLPGSFFMIKKEAIIESGLFDEGTFLYYEENILAIRMMKKKYRYYLVLDCEYMHDHSISINRNIPSLRKRLRIAAKSRLYYCTEYLGINKIQIIIFRITQMIGINDYILCKKLQSFVKKR